MFFLSVISHELSTELVHQRLNGMKKQPESMQAQLKGNFETSFGD